MLIIEVAIHLKEGRTKQCKHLHPMNDAIGTVSKNEEVVVYIKNNIREGFIIHHLEILRILDREPFSDRWPRRGRWGEPFFIHHLARAREDENGQARWWENIKTPRESGLERGNTRVRED